MGTAAGAATRAGTDAGIGAATEFTAGAATSTGIGAGTKFAVGATTDAAASAVTNAATNASLGAATKSAAGTATGTTPGTAPGTAPDTAPGTAPATAPGTAPDTAPTTTPPAARRAFTIEPILLELSGPLTDPRAEVSGMTWKGDTLIVLPQDPTLFAAAGQLGFFVMTRSQILAAIDDPGSGPIVPRQVNCLAPGLSRIVRGFDGLEAIGLLGDRCYLTVEAGDDTSMAGYLASGRYDMVNDEVVMDMTRLTAIPLGLNIPNVAEETIIIADGQVITISEANGRNLNPEPRAKVFSPDLDLLVTIPMPNIEYRVTDATAVAPDGRFWVANYFFPPERDKLRPVDDPEPPPAGGLDPEACIERLLELRLVRTCVRGDYIERTDTPPVYLKPTPDGVCRNWEALVRLDDRGFLLMTDKYPGTLLAFVPFDFSEVGLGDLPKGSAKGAVEGAVEGTVKDTAKEETP